MTAQRTGIEWTDTTWNPVTGCSKVSAGCKNCYAETIANRFWKDRKFTDVQCHEDRLTAPLKWRKPRRVFVNSMSDLFHDDVPDEFIDRVFAVMALSPQHTFQVLTKRPVRMRSYCRTLGRHHESDRVSIAAKSLGGSFKWTLGACGWHLPNVWLGVSVEDQEAADARIPLLLDTPAAVRFLSCEPLLGPIDLAKWMPHEAAYIGEVPSPSGKMQQRCSRCGRVTPGAERVCRTVAMRTAMPDWVIVGGESGPGARPCDVAWIRSIVEQCKAAKTACFVKQLGAMPLAWQTYQSPPRMACGCPGVGECPHIPVGAMPSLRLRDRKGADPSEWPEDLRVREMPR